MGVLGSLTGRDEIDAEQVASYQAALEQISAQDRVNGFDVRNLDHRLVFVAFDGTSSDRAKLNAELTNPAILERMVSQNEQIHSSYVHGVGTRCQTLLHSVVEMATGFGTEQRAEMAYRNFVSQVQNWHEQNPSIEPHLVTTGFSRGVGSQRHFANLVEDYGVANRECTDFLIAPGQVKQDFMLMFDGVVTGQERAIDMPIPISVQSTLHLVAADEKRKLFDLSSTLDPINPTQSARLEIELPGRHSDVGGGVPYGGLSARALQLGIHALEQHNVPLQALPEHYLSQSDQLSLTSNNRFLPFNFESSERQIDQFSDRQLGPQFEPDEALDRACDLSPMDVGT